MLPEQLRDTVHRLGAVIAAFHQAPEFIVALRPIAPTPERLAHAQAKSSVMSSVSHPARAYARSLSRKDSTSTTSAFFVARDEMPA